MQKYMPNAVNILIQIKIEVIVKEKYQSYAKNIKEILKK